MEKQLRLLRRLGASSDLIAAFEQVCEINDSLPVERRASYGELLKEQCRRFAFEDILDDGWFFRPYAMGEPGFRSDTPVGRNEAEAATIEQAYRRGYDQGFAECLELVNEGNVVEASTRSKAIHAWRVRSLQQFGSFPGAEEKPDRNIFAGRAGLSARLRWTVLERDGRRCVVCGRAASAGVELHVDHIWPVSRGGRDDLENLQTLCAPCNLGKSDRT